MSTKDARNEARLINIAMAFLSGTPDKRDKLTVERDLVVRALELVRDKACECLADIRDEEFRKKMTNPKFAADVQKRKEHNVWRAQRFKEIKAVAAVTRKRTSQLTAIGREVVSLFDSIKIDGQAIGTIWYSQLEGLRNKGAFEAALCQSLLNRGKPTDDMQVSKFVSPEMFAGFVADAKRAVNRVKAAA